MTEASSLTCALYLILLSFVCRLLTATLLMLTAHCPAPLLAAFCFPMPWVYFQRPRRGSYW